MANLDLLQPLKGISPDIGRLLSTLHAQSSEQEAKITPSEWQPIRKQFTSNPATAKAALDALMIDKFIALDEDKCQFIHSLLLSMAARNVVEIGTSFGVSTIYLASAVSLNAARSGTNRGVVIATEKESSKAKAARENWTAIGNDIEKWIKLLEGDLTETLVGDLGLDGEMVDFVLLDIWSYVALPALEILLPNLRPGAVIITDNIIHSADGYQDLIRVLRDPNGKFQSVTLPYKGGLEMSVYWP